MDRCLIEKQVFLRRAPKRGAMGIRGAKVGVPGVEMRIKMHQSHGPHMMIDGSQQGEGNGVVAANTHNPSDLAQKLGCCSLDLLNRLCNVVGIARHIPGVSHLLLDEWLCIVGGMVLRAKVTRGLPNGLRSKSSAWAIARAAIKGNAENRDIASGHISQFGEPRKGGRARKTGYNGTAHRLYGLFAAII